VTFWRKLQWLALAGCVVLAALVLLLSHWWTRDAPAPPQGDSVRSAQRFVFD
jgi:hypothetical protein